MRRACGIIIGSIFIIFGFFCGSGSAVEANDGFEAAKNIKSRYFDIFVENGVDTHELAVRLTVPSSIAAIIREPISFSPNSYDVGDQVDLLFLAISEIMDIKLTNFKCSVKICRNSSSLSNVANKLFDKQIQTGGFYVVALDTLYVDAENITINILGHELSHAVQSRYFVIPPPTKIQEILAGYVEYQLRKYTNSLPK